MKNNNNNSNNNNNNNTNEKISIKEALLCVCHLLFSSAVGKGFYCLKKEHLPDPLGVFLDQQEELVMKTFV